MILQVIVLLLEEPVFALFHVSLDCRRNEAALLVGFAEKPNFDKICYVIL